MPTKNSLPRRSVQIIIRPILVITLAMAVPARGESAQATDRDVHLASAGRAQDQVLAPQADAVRQICQLVDELVADSYPELRGVVSRI